jgi:hypothetical protein
MTRFFTPLCFVLVAMALVPWIEGPLESFLAPIAAGMTDETWHRHESPLYWLDADWLPACAALFGVCAFDLYDRMRSQRRRLLDHPVMLLPFAAGGAVSGLVTLAQPLTTAAHNASAGMNISFSEEVPIASSFLDERAGFNRRCLHSAFVATVCNRGTV